MVCCSEGAAAGVAPRDARLQQAQAAFDEANTLWDAGRYAEAVSRDEQALALFEVVLGSTHPEVARSLDLLGRHLLLQGNSARAEPLLQRALAIREAALGKNAPEVAQTLTTLGNLYAAQQLYARAEPPYAHALAIREEAFGREHPLVAESLNHLANLYYSQDLYARAEPLYLRALAIREAALGKVHPDVAQTLSDLAGLYHQQMFYSRAEPLYVRAVAIREAALGKEHPLVAEPLYWLGYLYRQQGLHARAQPLLSRALAIWETALGRNPPDVAWLLDKLGFIYCCRGSYTLAQPLLERALALREVTLGGGHPLVAESLSHLATNDQAQGLYAQAEPLHERALAIREAALGGSHDLVSDSLADLAVLFMEQGLYTRAQSLLERALAHRRATFGDNHPYVANDLVALANVYVAQGSYRRAEPLLERGLAIMEAVCGERHPLVAKYLSDLANLYVAQGLYRRATPLHARALAIREAAQGRTDVSVALSLSSLAGLDLARGAYPEAGARFERALTMLEGTFGKHHPRVAETLNNLATVRLAQHRLTEALPLFTRAFTLSEQRLREEALGFSESRLASFLQFLRRDEERLYALLRAHPDDARVRRLALSAALLLKGRSVEETADISRTVYRSLGAEDRDTFARLRELRTQLAQLSLQGPGSLAPRAYQQQIEELTDQGAALEADLARRSAPLRALTALPPPTEIVDRVAAALPGDGALVEFVTYVDRPLVPRAGASQRPDALRYLALVLFPDSTTRAVDLGPAEPIDLAASRLRDALANRDASFEAPAQALHQLAFQPLLRLLGKTRRVFLSPEGQLALVPFAALHDGQRFLVEAFDFTYLPSGKDLLPHPREGVPPDAVVVLANPDFSTPRPALPDARRDAPALRTELERRAWAPTPLPGTRKEAEAIQRLLPQAQLFLGPEATKERLLRLPAPGILHLATHGFFLEDAPEPTGSRAVIHFGALGEDPQASSPADPLLRSGLVFAGARDPASSGASQAPPPDSALVTALELAGLDLWGTQLVVLSACDTGRGDVKLGQGVYGLRRAFLVAGAETVVMSLWKVDDRTTSTLMEAYYRHLMAGQGRAAALREAMLELRRTQSHPHFWAPFITMGQATPLRLPTSSAQEALH
ncbi:CHAT domain-containing protein [Corallococcus llansteffanensis]|uniref:CHAT domain-containing protein n=2 Tax=Corallococcus llansteffanensis TaxID=2316731 RepID=A0A3A8QCK0_9BACT|nr:CHAT domain-containing protein [Corallococcus llansteffanensis]